jgi:hypothetical protein
VVLLLPGGTKKPRLNLSAVAASFVQASGRRLFASYTDAEGGIRLD